MQSIYTSTHTELRSLQSLQSGRTGDGGVPAAGYSAVKQDIIEILTISQDFFPADFADTVGANYGPLMIRLAWHCSGSYRATDGRGGCDGGRIRHDPELSWPDNVSCHLFYYSSINIIYISVSYRAYQSMISHNDPIIFTKCIIV
jgi:catalase (peroxidase I)